MPEIENIPSTAMRVTAHDLATRLKGTLRSCAHRAVSCYRTLGDGLVSIDDVISDVLMDFVENPQQGHFSTKNEMIWHCQKLADRAANRHAKRAYMNYGRTARLFDVNQSGEEYESRAVARYSMAATAGAIENAVYARQVLRVIDDMPRELRNTAMFMADGADLIEFAKESGLSLREAMAAQKALRAVLFRLMEDGRQERAEKAIDHPA